MKKAITVFNGTTGEGIFFQINPCGVSLDTRVVRRRPRGRISLLIRCEAWHKPSRAGFTTAMHVPLLRGKDQAAGNLIRLAEAMERLAANMKRLAKKRKEIGT